jgi:2-polyprenyl-3-methyl-5-hydroxy-6-metoxy-1,4-benzoquinol methylase
MRNYPANDAAFRFVLEHVAATQSTSLIEAGIGHGNAIPTWLNAGLTISGFDNDQESVQAAQSVMAHHSLDSDAVCLADARDFSTLRNIPQAGESDICVAMGVAPHCEDTTQVVENLLTLTHPQGTVFIEFRNVLFSLFTFNRYTFDFFMKELLPQTTTRMQALTAEFLTNHLEVGTPAKPAPLSQFHNPLTIKDELRAVAGDHIEVLPFHYHATLPLLANLSPDEYLETSWQLESREPDWRSLFLCSAFLVKISK